MRLILFIILITTFFSCKDSNANKQAISKKNRESIGQDIIGIWELLKISYRPSEKPALVDASDKEYLEINEDGTCQEGRYRAKWFLSYTDEYIIDSTSKVMFTIMTNLSPNSYGEYRREMKSYQINVATENNIKYLYLTTLESSETRIYIRKN